MKLLIIIYLHIYLFTHTHIYIFEVLLYIEKLWGLLGAYDDEEAAAHAYDLAALKYWGQDTILNFPVNFFLLNTLFKNILMNFPFNVYYLVHVCVIHLNLLLKISSYQLIKKSSKKWRVNQKKNILDL